VECIFGFVFVVFLEAWQRVFILAAFFKGGWRKEGEAAAAMCLVLADRYSGGRIPRLQLSSRKRRIACVNF
jgi:hypothetical protein